MREDQIEKEIKSLNASFAMEGMYITPEEEKSARAILSGERSIDNVISELNEKWSRKENNK